VIGTAYELVGRLGKP